MAPSNSASFRSNASHMFVSAASTALLEGRVPEMPEQRFWALVERLDWTNAAARHEELAQALARDLDLREVLAASATCERLRMNLIDRVEAWGDSQGSSLPTFDEPFWNMYDHVIWRGHAEYERVMADPGREVERASRAEYPALTSLLDKARWQYSDEAFVEALRQLLSPRPFKPGALKPKAVVEHPHFGMGVVADVSDGQAQVVFPERELFVKTGGASAEDGEPSRPSELVASEEYHDLRRVAGFALHQALPPMAEERFWALVERIGWADEHGGHEARGQALARELDLLELVAASATLYSLEHRLSTRLEEWETESGRSIPCGDDGFSDLCHHIVGLGRAEYGRVWEEPALALERAERGTFRESFAYVFQSAGEAYSDEAYIEALRRGAAPKPFDPEHLSDGAVVEHPRFGVGVVRREERRDKAARVVFAQGDLVVEQ